MRIDRSRYELEVDERFDGDALDERLWLRHYLPHWSSREASAARFDVGEGELRLRIDANQQPWNPDHDGWLRVSCLQTGQFSGPLGSRVGQLQFAAGLRVREEQPAVALYTPLYGLFEIRLRGIADPANMVALWMIGFEDEPQRSGEILICEVFGREMRPDGARIGMGIRPWADPTLSDGFAFVPVEIDPREPHWYAAEWTPDRVTFFVDEQQVKVAEQSPAYPLQFMLSLYEFADGPEPPSPLDAYPKVAVVEQFRGWRPVSGRGARLPAWPHEADERTSIAMPLETSATRHRMTSPSGRDAPPGSVPSDLPQLGGIHMSIKRSILGMAAVAAFAVSACAGTSASAVPSVEIPSVPASIGTGDLQGFCEDFASTLATDWPNIDQATANELSSVVTEWSTTPGLDSVKGDVQTIGTWLTTTAQSGAASSPPADVQTAFDNITAFADANC